MDPNTILDTIDHNYVTSYYIWDKIAILGTAQGHN